MKTKVFLFVCLFAGIAFTTSFAQDKEKNAYHAYQGWYQTPIAAGVFCSGEMTDILYGEATVHWVARFFKNGEVVRMDIEQIKGKVTNSDTGEVFKFNRTARWKLSGTTCPGIVNFNMIGNQGSHYTGKIHIGYELVDNKWVVTSLTVLHVVCK